MSVLPHSACLDSPDHFSFVLGHFIGEFVKFCWFLTPAV